MIPFFEGGGVRLFHGDCLEVLCEIPDASVHAVVTDPPYGLDFMGKAWDRPAAMLGQISEGDRSKGALPTGPGTNSRGHADHDGRAFQQWCEAWAVECLRVLTPGGHMLAFGGSRTWHRLAAAVEDAGFEIRDSIAWLHGQGFAKAGESVTGRAGWATQLKPAFEPIVVARKPLRGTVAATVLAHGTGALNIDATRIGTEGGTRSVAGSEPNRLNEVYGDGMGGLPAEAAGGRWPANVVLDESQAAELDQQSGTLTSGKVLPHHADAGKSAGIYGAMPGGGGRESYGDTGGASRFFYTAKADSGERPRAGDVAHPTVKPLDLMRWLVRLVTPPGGLVLDPFAGSGTTAEACVREGFECVVIEREEIYLPLVVARLSKDHQQTLFADLDGGVS